MTMPTCKQHCSTASFNGVDNKAQRLVTEKHAVHATNKVVAAPPKINQGPLIRAD